ncbi:endonuclease domain-containing protein [Desulfosporosinus sp. SB140]|uniref:endonuclease domain-containing protein n=1 Tax=Desulfosporosinus paludis TaxID=3115649 RepID=UPI00388E39CC
MGKLSFKSHWLVIIMPYRRRHSGLRFGKNEESLLILIVGIILLQAIVAYFWVLLILAILGGLIWVALRWFISSLIINTPDNCSKIEMTPIEEKMYYALKRAGYEPIPQYKESGYRLDFAILEDGKKIDIECDGKAYHSTPKQKSHDRSRTRRLNNAGWGVIRFSGSQIHRDADRCVERLTRRLKDF